jgi:hypothetical protein
VGAQLETPSTLKRLVVTIHFIFYQVGSEVSNYIKMPFSPASSVRTHSSLHLSRKSSEKQLTFPRIPVIYDVVRMEVDSFLLPL